VFHKKKNNGLMDKNNPTMKIGVNYSFLDGLGSRHFENASDLHYLYRNSPPLFIGL